MSNPQLVLVIRRLLKENVTWRLINGDLDPPNGPLFRAAVDEAKKRNITIDHPEQL